MWDWVSELQALRARGEEVAIVTVASCSGSSPRETGAKMLVLGDGRFFGTIGGGHLEQLAIEEARRSLREGKSRVCRYPLGAKTGQCCGGVVDLMFEVLDTGPRLLLFGAGHVGQAICRVLEGTPFSVHLIDERREWVDAPGLPARVVRHAQSPEEFLDAASWDPERDRARTYAAIMTHRHDLDQEILEELLAHPLRYLGLIGSRGKWARFRSRLEARGIAPEALSRVRCPIGLKVAGKAPQEVAISFAAELLQIHYADVAVSPSVVRDEGPSIG